MSEYEDHIRAQTPLGSDHYVNWEYLYPDLSIKGYPARLEDESAILIGLHEHHRQRLPLKEGYSQEHEWCGGWVAFRNVLEALPNLEDIKAKWSHIRALFDEDGGHQLIEAVPLHVEASLACRRCSSHGFIRNGQWTEA